MGKGSNMSVPPWGEAHAAGKPSFRAVTNEPLVRPGSAPAPAQAPDLGGKNKSRDSNKTYKNYESGWEEEQKLSNQLAKRKNLYASEFSRRNHSGSQHSTPEYDLSRIVESRRGKPQGEFAANKTTYDPIKNEFHDRTAEARNERHFPSSPSTNSSIAYQKGGIRSYHKEHGVYDVINNEWKTPPKNNNIDRQQRYGNSSGGRKQKLSGSDCGRFNPITQAWDMQPITTSSSAHHSDIGFNTPVFTSDTHSDRVGCSSRLSFSGRSSRSSTGSRTSRESFGWQ